MAQGLRLAAVGVVVGVGVALILGRGLASLLYAIQPGDPLTLVGVVVVVMGIVALACWIPAVRATRVDPAVILRAE